MVSNAKSRRITLAVAAAVLVSGLFFGALWYVGAGRTYTVKEILAGEKFKAEEATSELCMSSEGPACIEGWKTDFGNYIRFASEGQARHWEILLGDDSRRVRTIVLDMSGKELSFEERRIAIETLYSTEDFG